MKRLATLEIEKVIGGDLDAGCGFAIGVVTQSSFSAQNSNFLLAPAPILSGLQVEKFAELAVHKTVTRHTKTAYAPRPTHT